MRLAPKALAPMKWPTPLSSKRSVDFAGGYCGSVDCIAVGAAFDDGLFSFGPDGDVAVYGSPQRGARLCAKGGGVVDLTGADELACGHRARGSRRRVQG